MYNFDTIKQTMKEKHITQLDIVRDTGLAPRTVRRVLYGENVTLETLKIICDYVGITICEALGSD